MRISHGFFIPDATYCFNISGLIHYLREKIEIGLMCITCNNNSVKNFNTSEALK